MHPSVLQFLRDSVRPDEIAGKDVLEVGAQDINGSPREILLPHSPGSYIGIDFGPGRGVDLVLDVKNIVTHFGSARFDVVVSTEMLEHAEDWQGAVTRMKEVLRPGGILLLTARGPGFPHHGFPYDYWRFTVENFKVMFSDMTIDVCMQDTSLTQPGVFLKAYKTDKTGSVDLSKISVSHIKTVDLLVVTWNTLPWLKLLVNQVRRLQSEAQVQLFVWDNASKDGTRDWLVRNGIKHHFDPIGRPHGDSLSGLIAESNAPYIAFLDVDAIPTKVGWLDDAVSVLQDETVGAAGLSAGSQQGYHRTFVHPSFCVFRRDLYNLLKVAPEIVPDFTRQTTFDVGEAMCMKYQDNGYGLRFLGSNDIDIAAYGRWPNKVVHFKSSTCVLAEQRVDRDFLIMVDAVVKWHQRLLSCFGLLDEFEGFVRESVDLNPHCSRYLTKTP